jgi:hypothetical protein
VYSGADDRRHQELLSEVFATDTSLVLLPCVLNSLELEDELGNKVSSHYVQELLCLCHLLPTLFLI